MRLGHRPARKQDSAPESLGWKKANSIVVHVLAQIPQILKILFTAFPEFFLVVFPVIIPVVVPVHPPAGINRPEIVVIVVVRRFVILLIIFFRLLIIFFRVVGPAGRRRAIVTPIMHSAMVMVIVTAHAEKSCSKQYDTYSDSYQYVSLFFHGYFSFRGYGNSQKALFIALFRND